jgi:hypothetical protein
MVSLDPKTKKYVREMRIFSLLQFTNSCVSRPVPVAPLIVETEEEKALFKKGEENYMAKKALRKRSLLERAPDDEESDLIHSMWTKEMSYISTSLRKSPSLLDPTNTVSQTPKFPPSAPQTKSP